MVFNFVRIQIPGRWLERWISRDFPGDPVVETPDF